jgi:hypothetical protein
MAKHKQTFIRGTAPHRRTQTDYIAALLDVVTVEDWRDVVVATLQAAKGGDDAARTWLAHYLVGKPASAAPTPLAVVVQQLAGSDPVVDALANPIISRESCPMLYEDDGLEKQIKARIAAELADRVAPQSEATPS